MNRRNLSRIAVLLLMIALLLPAAIPAAAAAGPVTPDQSGASLNQPAATGGSTGYTLLAGGTGTAALSIERPHPPLSNKGSVKLATVTGDDTGMVRFEYAKGALKLDNLTTLSYWENVAARENPLDVFIDIWLDFNGDGVADASDYPGYLQAEPLYTVGEAPLNTWTQINAMTLKWSTYVGPDNPYNAPTIADFQANTVPTWTNNVDFGQLDILRVDVRVGYGGTWANFTGYADDIQINDYLEKFPLPSSNEINKTKGWGHVNQTAVGVGSTTLEFVSTRTFLSCFEYRTDGDTNQRLRDSNGNLRPNPNLDITDGLYPFVCVNNSTTSQTIAAREYAEVRLTFGADGAERFDWTRFDVGTGVNVSNLQPSWTAPGGGGVYAAYYTGPYDSQTITSPGATSLIDGREAGIIKAGLVAAEPWDEGLLGFKVDNVAIAAFATQALTFDVANESGANPVWVRIRLVGGTTYQFVPATNPAGWHTVDAAAGSWQLMDGNGNAMGPTMTLAEVATANPSAQVDRVYLTLGMGSSYNVSSGVGTVGWVDKVTIGLKTYDFVLASTTVDLTTSNSLFCVGKNTTINLNLHDVTNLYGYQVKVGFDPAKATASDAAFDNTWFNTAADAFIPTGYNKDCSVAGTCAFGASKFLPATPWTGSGKIASFKLTATTLGAFDVTITEAILTDKDGFAPAVRTITLPLTVCGNATVNGTVALQGRSTPIDAGSVKLTNTDPGTTFGPYTVAFNKDTGAWTANVQYMPGGSNYTVDALHSLYLTNEQKPVAVSGNVTLLKTTLKGGDANNDGTVAMGDLSCIGGAFGGAVIGSCSGGSSDINADGVINIQDLSIAGGNYNKASPQAWAW